MRNKTDKGLEARVQDADAVGYVHVLQLLLLSSVNYTGGDLLGRQGMTATRIVNVENMCT